MTERKSTSGAKLLVLAAYFPPAIGGSPTLLYNLFRHFPSGSYAAVVQNVGSFEPENRLPCTYYRIPNGLIVRKIAGRAWPMIVPLIERIALRAVRRENPTALFLNIPTGAFVIAGWRLARRLSLPYYVFLHDLWEENESPLYAHIIRPFEKQIMAGAETVFTITDMARQYYLNKHGVDSKILLHTIDPEFTRIPPRTRPAWKSGKPFRVVTSGSFYPKMNVDALISLYRAIAARPNEAIELRILTSRTNDPIWEGFSDPRVSVRSCKKQEVWQELADADLLYVPLAFRSDSPEEVETVFPTKVTEYVLADVPILVHGPGQCYTVDYARRKGWAYTVDQAGPDAVWEGIIRLRDNEQLRKGFSSAGRKIVKERNATDISLWLQEQVGITTSIDR